MQLGQLFEVVVSKVKRGEGGQTSQLLHLEEVTVVKEVALDGTR